MSDGNIREVSRAILDYWFSTLDDSSSLDREVEPFKSCFPKWFGGGPKIDDEIRTLFEPALKAATRDGARWEQQVDAWRRESDGLLALIVLLDQFPRNMYRNSPAMYEYDALALAVTTTAMREYEDAPLSLIKRQFLYMPLMHVESLTLQQLMVAKFEGLAELAATRSPQNVGSFKFSLDYARRHLVVVEKFGRFPHRNDILRRSSTPEEIEFLKGENSRF